MGNIVNNVGLGRAYIGKRRVSRPEKNTSLNQSAYFDFERHDNDAHEIYYTDLQYKTQISNIYKLYFIIYYI